MSNSSTQTGCWTRCLWCITTCGGRRISQVTPSDPIPVASEKAKNGHTPIDTAPVSKTTVGNGQINHFFVPDDNDGNPEGRDATDGENVPRVKEVCTVQLGTDTHLENSVFIEIGKERQIRVVHLTLSESSDDPISPSCSTANASNGSSSKEASPAKEKPEDEEEDEYWFSKWTRKPRFRSIFEKNTIRGGAPEEDEETDNNNMGNGNGGGLSKDFEAARAAAAAKRRAWAYNNENGDDVVQQSTVVDTDDEFNSIDICDPTSTRWRKNGAADNNSSPGGSPSLSESKKNDVHHQVEVDVQNHSSKQPPTTHVAEECQSGFTNLGFEENEEQEQESVSPKAQTEDNIISSPKSAKSEVTKEGFVSEDSLTVIPLDDPEPLQATNNGLVQQPIIFFIHGISGSSEVWKSQMDYFINLGYEIVAPDLLGHGYSSTPYNVKYYFFESLAQDLLSVFDYFVEEGRKVVLIGHGYGACLASVITRVRPKSVCLLISIAGGGPTPLISRTCCRSSLLPFYCKLFHTNKKKGRFDNPEIRHVLPPIIYNHILTGQVWSDGDSAFYRRITVPTLLVYGMKDKVTTLVEMCEMERTIPKSFLEIIDTAGHMVMFDDPVKLNKMLGKFIYSWS